MEQKTCIWPVCITYLIISVVLWCFCINWLIFYLLKSFFSNIIKTFLPYCWISFECAGKCSITLRIEEEEIKYRSTLYLTCQKYLGRMHVHTGDTAPEFSPGTICSSLMRTEDVYEKKPQKRAETSENVLVGTNVF